MSILVVYRDLEDGERYASAIKLAGGEPRLAEAKPGLTLGDATALLLTGGTDVNPALFGETPVPETDPPDDARDASEGALIDEAVSRDIPLLAICRGMQILNVHLGGTLVQHLPNTPDHRQKTPQNPGLPVHTVTIEPETLLSRIAGAPAWQVNSRHHQAVARPGKGLTVSARAEDGTIEALELPGHRFVLAVQWHSEDQAAGDPAQRHLFESFVNAL